MEFLTEPEFLYAVVVVVAVVATFTNNFEQGFFQHPYVTTTR